jgi:EDD domain protein, DegV family
LIRIITDSTADISLELAEKLNIEVVPLKVIFNQEIYDDGVDLKTDEFYQKLVAAEQLPTTSQPSPEAFLKIFEDVKEKNDEAIVILLSSKISGTVQSAMIAKDMAEYDGIHVIDSLNATIGLSLLVDVAIKLREQGLLAKEIVDRITNYIPKTKIIAVVDTLEYFVKGGRLSKTAGMAGKMLNLKPVVTLVDGTLEVISKARGLKKSYRWINNYILETYQIDLSLPIYYGYTGEPLQFDNFISTMHGGLNIEKAPYEKRLIGCVIGTHAGPGAMAIAFITE